MDCSKRSYGHPQIFGQPKNAQKGRHSNMATKAGNPSLSIEENSRIGKTFFVIDAVMNM